MYGLLFRNILNVFNISRVCVIMAKRGAVAATKRLEINSFILYLNSLLFSAVTIGPRVIISPRKSAVVKILVSFYFILILSTRDDPKNS